MKPSVLVAAGCSWVAAKSIDLDPAVEIFDFNHVEDTAVVEQKSFAGILKSQLGLDQLVMLAQHGANNEQQIAIIVDFVERNRNNYSKIFVIWGISSIYRWRMHSATSNQIEDCMVGRKQISGIEEEIKHYFKNYWNKELELSRLGTDILMLHGYLDNYKIQHLFFNSFQSYSDSAMKCNIDDNYFYKIKEDSNDMLTFLCNYNGISNSPAPWLNILAPKGAQYNTNAVKELQGLGWLDRATAHPTIIAHQTIAKELENYIKGQDYERV